MASIPYRMWSSYYLLLLSQQDIKPNTVLDVCCGTGTVAELLHDEGLEMTGIDLSPAMIQRARAKAAEKEKPIRYEVADATSFDLGVQFDAAYSFFDSLNYITTAEGLERAIQQIANHVKPGGSFVFDLNTTYAFEEELFTQSNLSKNAKVRYLWEGDWNPWTKIITVNMKFWHGDDEYHEVHVQRAHSEAEVRLFLNEAGFEDVRMYNSYTLDPARRVSDRVHYTAVKR